MELFESCGPRVVTQKQYEDIVAAQKEKKLAFEFSLAYVIEERFFAIAPNGVLPAKETAKLVDVLDHCSEVWLAENGDYKGPGKPSQWITRRTELFLGLVSHDNKPKKSIKSVGAKLRDRLDTAEQNIRLFLGVKAILDAALEAVGLDVPSDEGVLIGANIRLDAFIALYNIRLEELKEKRRPWESAETRLERALKMLTAIDLERLRPSPNFLKQLKGRIIDYPQGEEWLRAKVYALEYDDGFSFNESHSG